MVTVTGNVPGVKVPEPYERTYIENVYCPSNFFFFMMHYFECTGTMFFSSLIHWKEGGKRAQLKYCVTTGKCTGFSTTDETNYTKKWTIDTGFTAESARSAFMIIVILGVLSVSGKTCPLPRLKQRCDKPISVIYIPVKVTWKSPIVASRNIR